MTHIFAYWNLKCTLPPGQQNCSIPENED